MKNEETLVELETTRILKMRETDGDTVDTGDIEFIPFSVTR